jgi:steroid delta-isomerase-like uncharacterized protein
MIFYKHLAAVLLKFGETKIRQMKPPVKAVLILWAALLTGTLSFSQTKANDSLTNLKTAMRMNSQNENKSTVRKLYEEILNTGKMELLAQVISDEYTGALDRKGPAAFAENISPVRAAFPDIRWTIEDLIAEDDKVVARWSWTGTNTASFAGFPPSNKTVIHHAISIFQFSGSKIIKAWMQADRLGFFQQIGVIAQDVTTPPIKK